MARQKYPVGIETFSEIREKGYLYIDKTEFVHNLVTEGKYYFLSRPRRFGKSLLLTTIASFFEGRRDLFEGLAISRYEHSWEAHPIFHLNLVNFDASSESGLRSALHARFSEWESIYGRNEEEQDFPQRFYGLLRRAYEQTGHQAVVLIDEYDKAFVSTFDSLELHDRFRAILKPIYSNLKSADRYIRFGMITGVSRFSRLSIFSDVNNLYDISMLRDFNSICGITEMELLENCQEGIESMAEQKGISFGEAAQDLKFNYDGYHFSADCPDIYNPYSLMCALRSGEIGQYWFSTGTPTFLVNALRSADEPLSELLNEEAFEVELTDVDSYSRSVVPLLFQTGYLTIKSYDAVFGAYRLGIPNREVEVGLFRNLLQKLTDNRSGMRELREFHKQIVAGEPDKFLKRLKSFLADIPYNLSENRHEIYFENNLYVIFKMIGFSVKTEYMTSDGRIDIVLSTDRFVYVMELKLQGSAEDALRQIEEKDYALPFERDGRRLYKIGISFSKQTRTIDSWIIR